MMDLKKKIIAGTTILSVLLLFFSLFFYNKLPRIIPTQINLLGQVTNSGNKENIFILPLCLLVLSFFFSGKWVDNYVTPLFTHKFVRILFYLFILAIWIYSISLYVYYFQLI